MSDILTPPIQHPSQSPKLTALLFKVVIKNARSEQALPLSPDMAEAIERCWSEYQIQKEITANYYLKKHLSDSENRPFRTQLDTAIAEMRRERITYQILLISSFKPFEYDSSLPLFEMLKNSGVNFRFIDFPAFDRNYIKIHIQYLKKKKESLPSDPAATPPPSKVPDASEAHHLNDNYTRLISRRKKMQTAYLGPLNLQALYALRQATDWQALAQSPTRAARFLNTNNILTARGNTHSPKTASRLVDRLLHLRNTLAFEPILKYHSLCARPLNAPPALPALPPKLKELPIKWENEIPDTNQQLTFYLLETFERTIEMTIFTHSLSRFQATTIEHMENATPPPPEKVYRWKQAFAPPLDRIDIHIVHDTALLPGIHYVCFQAEGYRDTWRCFTVLSRLR